MKVLKSNCYFKLRAQGRIMAVVNVSKEAVQGNRINFIQSTFRQIASDHQKINTLSLVPSDRKATSSQIQTFLNKECKTQTSKSTVCLVVVSEDEQQLLNHFSGGETKSNSRGGLRNINISQRLTEEETSSPINPSLRSIAVTEG